MMPCVVCALVYNKEVEEDVAVCHIFPQKQQMGQFQWQVVTKV